MNEDTQEGVSVNENPSIDVETLNQILSQYFYTKDEQNQIQVDNANKQINENETVLTELQAINRNLETLQSNSQLGNNIVYLSLVVGLGVFLLVMFYKYLKQFI